jgi:phosphatidylglycerophosphatase A
MTAVRPSLRFLVSRPQHFVALGCGAGLSPVWPGTVGSLLGFPVFLAMRGVPDLYKGLLYLLLFLSGAWCSTKTGEALKQQDHRSIVVDEIIGMSLVLEFIPVGALSWSLGFLLFRLFDSLKPWPINKVHSAESNGFLVMLDDVLAAAYAALGIDLLIYLFPSLAT